MTPGEIDRKCAEARDTLPRIWWALYVGAKDSGFSPDQALGLVGAFILAQNPHGIRPAPGAEGPADNG